MTTSTQDAIAAFLAKGGAIKKVDATATCGMTERQWHRVQRDDVVTVVLGKAYLPSHGFAVIVANCLWQISDRNRQLYLKVKGLIADFNADAEPEVEQYEKRLRYYIADMLAAIENLYAETIYDDVPMQMSNELWDTLCAASNALNMAWRRPY